MAVDNQQLLLVLHIKEKLLDKAAKLVNLRNPVTWTEIEAVLENHFGDPRDLSFFINGPQKMQQVISINIQC